MKDWFTADELADLRLPQLPHTRRGVATYAEREGWNEHPSCARKRKGRGGGMEYHLSLLPSLAQIVYTQAHLSVAAPVAANDEAASPAPTLSARARVERDARTAIVQAFNRFSAGLSTLSETARLSMFADRYRVGEIAVEDWIREAIPEVTPRSLRRWRQAVKKGAANTLCVDKAAARAGSGVLDTANDGKVKAFILALIAQNQHLSAEHIRMLCRSEFGDTIEIVRHGEKPQVPMPEIRTFQYALKRFKADNKVALTKLQNPDLFRSTMKPSGTGSLRHIKHPNALWQIDASPNDALCIDRRHSIYACIDIATRDTIIYYSPTPRASAVGLLIRKAILEWGVPDVIKTDNGSDFKANDTQRLLSSLGIELEVSDAYSPEQKGHVERHIKTFHHFVAPLMPGFIGHSVADRKVIENRKSFSKRLHETEAETFDVSLTGAEMQLLADRWRTEYYIHRPHGGLKGKTPFQVRAESSQRIHKVDETALDLLLMPIVGKDGYRTTTKFGIRANNFHYSTPTILPATRVFVRQDPLDMGRVYAFDEDGGRFLGEGICPELLGIDPTTWMKGVRETQAEIVKAGTTEMTRIMREITRGPALINRVLDVAARDVPNVVPLPKREVAHSTPQIAAALDALSTEAKMARETPIDEATAERQRALIADFEAGDPLAAIERIEARIARPPKADVGNVTHLPETAEQRYRRAVDIMDAIEKGEPIAAEDAFWVGKYQTTPEFKARAKMHEDFGDAYPVKP